MSAVSARRWPPAWPPRTIGRKNSDRPVKVVSAGHHNKADVGSVLVWRWRDTDGIDLVLDVANSAVALAVSDVVRRANRTLLVTTAVSSALTGDQCSPDTVHSSIDTWNPGQRADPDFGGGGQEALVL
jgi:branched-chain amino acid transport system substrate-binding protein